MSLDPLSRIDLFRQKAEQERLNANGVPLALTQSAAFWAVFFLLVFAEAMALHLAFRHALPPEAGRVLELIPLWMLYIMVAGGFIAFSIALTNASDVVKTTFRRVLFPICLLWAAALGAVWASTFGPAFAQALQESASGSVILTEADLFASPNPPDWLAQLLAPIGGAGLAVALFATTFANAVVGHECFVRASDGYARAVKGAASFGTLLTREKAVHSELDALAALNEFIDANEANLPTPERAAAMIVSHVAADLNQIEAKWADLVVMNQPNAPSTPQLDSPIAAVRMDVLRARIERLRSACTIQGISEAIRTGRYPNTHSNELEA